MPVTPGSQSQVLGAVEPETQLAKWDAEFASQQDIWSRALKWMLGPKAVERNSRTLQAAPFLSRITQPDLFPPELLIQVVEIVVDSQIPNGSVAKSATVTALTEELFVMSEGLDDGVRSILRDTVADVFSKSGSVKFSTSFTAGPTLVIPRVLSGKEHHLRRLVLDLQVYALDHVQHGALNKSIDSMVSMSALFPNLKSCVYLFHFKHVNHYYTPTLTRRGSLEHSYLFAVVNDRSRKNTFYLKETLLEFIDAFKQQGPGDGKFIRFGHTTKDGTRLGVGPLVCVSGHDKIRDGAAETAPERFGPQKLTASSDAELVLYRAYWGRLTRPEVIRTGTAERAQTVTLGSNGVLQFASPTILP